MSYSFDNGRRGGGWDRGGYNDRGRGYYNNDRGGYGGGYRGGYQGGYNQQPSQGFQFDIGQRVIHVATGIELSVINYGREQLECRKPDLSTVWCYEHELAPLENGTQPPQAPQQ